DVLTDMSESSWRMRAGHEQGGNDGPPRPTEADGSSGCGSGGAERNVAGDRSRVPYPSFLEIACTSTSTWTQDRGRKIGRSWRQDRGREIVCAGGSRDPPTCPPSWPSRSGR